MRQTDEDQFKAIMATLAEVYGKKLSPQTITIYWEALRPLAIEQVERAAKSAIRHFEHWPKPAQLYRLADDEAKATPRPAPSANLPDVSFGMRLINQMFLQYLHRRCAVEQFKGEMQIAARRLECVRLGEWIDAMKTEDMLPTQDECRAAFNGAMERVSDGRMAVET